MRETYYDVFLLPELLAEGKISRKDALNLIGEEITRNPLKFGITGDSREIISDLYFAIRKKGYFLFDHYCSSFGSFRTYLCSFIRFQIKTIKKENALLYRNRKTYSHVEATEYENAQEKYEKNEFDYKIMHFRPYSITRREAAPFIRSAVSEFPATAKKRGNPDDERKKRENPEERPLKQNHSILNDFSKTKQSEKKLALILTLKSCYYLNEDTIETISKFCGIKHDSLMKVISELKKTIAGKHERYETLKRRRDYSYFLHRKCLDKLKSLKEDNSPTDRIQRLYDFHTEKWINKNRYLQKVSYKVCPTNRAIAKVLGICERQVGYYMNRAEDILKIRKDKGNGRAENNGEKDSSGAFQMD